jgi:serine/threonine protein kinase
MKRERWQQIDRLYNQALECAPIQRAAFLDLACLADEELRREVESLLAAHEKAEQTEKFLNQPALEVAARALAEEQKQILSGRKIGHYQILHSIGMGGMGRVYLAQDTRLGRKLALKLLPPEFMQDQDRVQRFKQEARAASALNHPNIITVFEIDEIDGVHFFATEFIEGQTLRQQMTGGVIKLSRVLNVAIQVASALTAAHEAGVVHRDIKPENIMVRPDGYVKVLDFGLVKLIEPYTIGQATVEPEVSKKNCFHTDPKIILGTPRYISPEHISGHEVDARADIFSLGVVLYEMVAGCAPFEGSTIDETIAAVLDHQPLSLQRHSPQVPAELDRIVNKALAKDREERYQVVKDMLIDLRDLKLELELEARIKRERPSFVQKDGGGNDPSLVEDSSGVLLQSQFATAAGSSKSLEPVGGAVPLGSPFYIERTTDEEFGAAITRQDSIVLVKGARQVGKTSLLARGLQQAREAGAKVVLTDLQKLNAGDLASLEAFYLTLASMVAEQLDLEFLPGKVWHPHRGLSLNFERYVRRELLGNNLSQLVWGLDEVDRLFTCDFGSEVFGLFRSWHNERSLAPSGPWQRLTLVMAYATEAHLFITDMNQSPFNVGTRLQLGDFTIEQLTELNRRYGSPLRKPEEVARYFRLVGGHPYLVRCGLHEMATHQLDLPALESHADHDDGPFGDHLRRVLVSLRQDVELCEVVGKILQGKPCPSLESFYRLRSAGLILGDSAKDAKPRCLLYATYLQKHLL